MYLRVQLPQFDSLQVISTAGALVLQMSTVWPFFPARIRCIEGCFLSFLDLAILVGRGSTKLHHIPDVFHRCDSFHSMCCKVLNGRRAFFRSSPQGAVAESEVLRMLKHPSHGDKWSWVIHTW